MARVEDIPPAAGTEASWLFVPGDRPDRFAKAAAAGADAVILDLEDAVASPDKTSARRVVHEYLATGGDGWVRVNAYGTTWFEDDLRGLAGVPGLRGVMVPKVASVDVLAQVARFAPDLALITLIESAAGVLAAAEIAASGLTRRLALGSLDLAADLDAPPTEELLGGPRLQLALASRAAGLPGPVDGVTEVIDDDERVAKDARTARALGFTGKLCIHPRQVVAVAEAFAPSAEEVRWAREVMVARAARRRGDGSTAAFAVRGAMVDGPVIARAQAVLARVSDLEATVDE